MQSGQLQLLIRAQSSLDLSEHNRAEPSESKCKGWIHELNPIFAGVGKTVTNLTALKELNLIKFSANPAFIGSAMACAIAGLCCWEVQRHFVTKRAQHPDASIPKPGNAPTDCRDEFTALRGIAATVAETGANTLKAYLKMGAILNPMTITLSALTAYNTLIGYSQAPVQTSFAKNGKNFNNTWVGATFTNILTLNVFTPCQYKFSKYICDLKLTTARLLPTCNAVMSALSVFSFCTMVGITSPVAVWAMAACVASYNHELYSGYEQRVMKHNLDFPANKPEYLAAGIDWGVKHITNIANAAFALPTSLVSVLTSYTHKLAIQCCQVGENIASMDFGHKFVLQGFNIGAGIVSGYVLGVTGFKRIPGFDKIPEFASGVAGAIGITITHLSNFKARWTEKGGIGVQAKIKEDVDNRFFDVSSSEAPGLYERFGLFARATARRLCPAVDRLTTEQMERDEPLLTPSRI